MHRITVPRAWFRHGQQLRIRHLQPGLPHVSERRTSSRCARPLVVQDTVMWVKGSQRARLGCLDGFVVAGLAGDPRGDLTLFHSFWTRSAAREPPPAEGRKGVLHDERSADRLTPCAPRDQDYATSGGPGQDGVPGCGREDGRMMQASDHQTTAGSWKPLPAFSRQSSQLVASLPQSCHNRLFSTFRHGRRQHRSKRRPRLHDKAFNSPRALARLYSPSVCSEHLGQAALPRQPNLTFHQRNSGFGPQFSCSVLRHDQPRRDTPPSRQQPPSPTPGSTRPRIPWNPLRCASDARLSQAPKTAFKRYTAPFTIQHHHTTLAWLSQPGAFSLPER